MICRRVLFLVVILVFESRGHEETGHEETAHKETQAVHEHNSRLRDSKHVHDKEHIKEHLKDVTEVKEDSMSDEDLQFHYFKLHDYDNNDKLDGIELGNAMTHFHEDENTQEQTQDTSGYTDEQLSSMIDQILEEDDVNKDGYIDYTEFVGAQKKAETVTEEGQTTEQ